MAPQKRFTIHQSANLTAVFERRKPDNISGEINATIARYDNLMRELMPEFTRDEWCAILDANNGGTFPGDNDPSSIRMHLWANVANTIDLGEKWSVDQDALVDRLRKLSPPEAMAVGDAADIFWRHCDLDTDETLKLAGCKINRVGQIQD